MLMSEFPVVSVHIPPALRMWADGHDEVMASGETVGDVLSALGRTYPALAGRLLCSDGGLAEGVSVYLGGASVRTGGMTTPVGAEEVISLVMTGSLSCPQGAAEMPVPTVDGAAVGEISIGD